MSFARTPESFRQLNETLVERKVVPNRVLPALVGAAEEREALLKESVYFAKGESFRWGALDCHHDEGDVRVGRLLLSAHPGVAFLGDGGHYRARGRLCGFVLIWLDSNRVLRLWLGHCRPRVEAQHGATMVSTAAAQDHAVLVLVQVQVVQVLLDVDGLLHYRLVLVVQLRLY